jgi:hypothetical protein
MQGHQIVELKEVSEARRANPVVHETLKSLI